MNRYELAKIAHQKNIHGWEKHLEKIFRKIEKAAKKGYTEIEYPTNIIQAR